MTDDDKKFAVDMVYRDWRVRLARVRRDPERVGRMADIVWKSCADVEGDKEGRDSLEAFAQIRLESALDYEDIVSFIPFIVFGIVIKIIVSILIDYWFLHEQK